MNLQPLGDRIIVKKIVEEIKTSGGIIMPESFEDGTVKGEVIAAGPGRKDDPTVVKVGDKVMFGKHGGLEIMSQGEKYILLSESNIFAIEK